MCLNHDGSPTDQKTICGRSRRCGLSVIEGERRRSALPGNQSAFQHLAHVSSFSFLKPFKTGRFFFFMYFSLQSEFTLNPELKLQHMVRISTREGTSVCLFCS